MRALRRVHPLYWLALALLVASVVFTAATAKAPESVARTASVYDAGPGGAAALRRYLDVMGAATITLQGDAFDPDPARVGVLFVLAPAELVTTRDVDALRRYVESGGTLVFASDLSIFERSLSARLLEDLDVRIAGRLAPGTYDAGGIALADPPVHRIAIDQGATLTFGSGHVPLSAGTSSFAAFAREGRGTVVAIGSVGPFLTGSLGDADNGRFALALAAEAIAGGRAVAFDEYHHGIHPTGDVFILLERTWPGRALVFAMVSVFAYLVLSGRRLGPPVPLEVRAARSSLEYVRGFAGLVRRSGHGEIARRRLRRELRARLARRVGLDADMPFERIASALGANDPGAAARATALDGALARPLRESALIRTVREMDALLSDEASGSEGAQSPRRS